MSQGGTKWDEEHDLIKPLSVNVVKAKDAYSDTDPYNMVAEMKVNIGLGHRELGEAQQALEMMQEALCTFEDRVALENRTDLNFRQRIIKRRSSLVARMSGAKPAYRLSSSW